MTATCDTSVPQQPFQERPDEWNAVVHEFGSSLG
jgi:hypothetical protein